VRPKRTTTTADIETLIATQRRNLVTFLSGQHRKSAFLEGMSFALFSLQQGIGSGAAAGLARSLSQSKTSRA